MSLQSPFYPPTSKANDTKLNWGNLIDAAASLAIASYAKQNTNPILLITPDLHTSHNLIRELHFLCDPTLPIINFPDRETLPFDHFSPHEDITSDRIAALFKIPLMHQGIIVAALPTLMHRLPPKSYIQAHTFMLQCGDKLNPTHMRKQLQDCGYRQVDTVMEHGEYTSRGSIIDIFPMGSKMPFRIELFDEDIETIREFDPETQRSLDKTNEIRLLPAREYPLTENSIKFFRENWREQFSGNPQDSPLYTSISNGEAANGIEYYLPLFFPNTQNFFEYLPSNAQIFFSPSTKDCIDPFLKEVEHRYEQLRYDQTRPLCTPKQLYLNTDEFHTACKSFLQVQIHHENLTDKPGNINFSTESMPNIIANHKLKQPLSQLTDFLKKRSGPILFTAESHGRLDSLLELLHAAGIKPTTCDNWQSFINDSINLGITTAALDRGILTNTPNYTVICEAQLFGQQIMQRRLRKQNKVDPALMIRNLTELKIGAPVVHIDYGVGRYQGLKVITTGELSAEYVQLSFADDDKIYVPIGNLHLISRYSSGNAEHAPLQKLGNQQWAKTKRKSFEKIRDVAAELLAVYSKRAATPGFPFPNVNQEDEQFRAAFPFEETPDQTTAIDAVLHDMHQPHSMDRLICGDVGFGKTEVAMQAAFYAAHNGKQVAILVPTTLLANQHTENFKDRFSDWPIKIAELSRMQTKKDQEKTIKGLADGTIDIVIGTHKLLQPTIKFKDLGLLIVDEEHRFGVGQKDKIKQLRAEVDILTLTATPIPRTLNMALAGTRDLSIIATPPAKRLSIKTFVNNENDAIFREAIEREIMRGGQVYFIHNDIATLPAMAERIQKAIPQAKIGIAHGQMRERELEQAMSDFYHQRFNVLLCTTIVESGIDIPSANTIIINKADHFGLAQLHQLRGRVGRSHRQAYAYLFVHDQKSISSDAKKRLQAISELEDLGAGFNLANHDLEIRGAGELLGEEQSGHMEAIGFSLYMELLEEAVKALKSGDQPQFENPNKQGPEIDLHISSLIPETLIPDVNTRLTLYKRLAHCQTDEDIQEIKAEMIDRFGKLPEATLNLLAISKLKLTAQKLGITKIDMGKQYGYIDFIEKPPIDPMTIIELIQKHSKKFQLQNQQRLRFTVDDTEKDKISAIRGVLKHLIR